MVELLLIAGANVDDHNDVCDIYDCCDKDCLTFLNNNLIDFFQIDDTNCPHECF